MTTHVLSRRLFAEFLGTFWLVLGGCGSAVLAAGLPDVGIRYAGVALAFGLTVLTGAYAFGPISGGHFNPAVTLGLWVGRRIPGRDVVPYVIAQVAGAIIAAAVLYVIASGVAGGANAGSVTATGFASNGYGVHSPGQYTLAACIICELVMTFMFVMVILGSTDARAAGGFAPLAVGFALTLIHLVSIPVTNTSVNPARSTGPALFAGGWALAQLWMFWVVPLAGGALAGLVYRLAFGERGIAAEKPALGGEGDATA
jgi:aquaporin Z